MTDNRLYSQGFNCSTPYAFFSLNRYHSKKEGASAPSISFFRLKPPQLQCLHYLPRWLPQGTPDNKSFYP